MPSIKEMLAAKIKEIEAHNAARKAAASAGIPPELQEEYDALTAMAASGQFPKDIPGAASALASAAKIAQARKLAPAVIPGTKDLQWPPTQAFAAPIGYAPYLPQFKQVLAMTFPQPANAAPNKTDAAKGINAPVPKLDPLAAIREMGAKGAAQAAQRTSGEPLAQSVNLATADTDPGVDEP